MSESAAAIPASELLEQDLFDVFRGSGVAQSWQDGGELTPEHLSFGDLELVHVPFYGPRAPALGQPSVDGIPVALQVATEAAQFRWTSLVYVGNPLIQFATASFPNQA